MPAAILRRVRRLNDYYYRLRWGTLEERRRRGLIRLHEILSGTVFADRYWLTMGLLLGCMRDGLPIAWDRDCDFGFMDRDLPQFLLALRKLRAAGFDLRAPQVNNDGRTTMWTLKHRGIRYDFVLFDRLGPNVRWYYHQRKPPMEIVNEVPAHGLADYELYGCRWRIPNNAEDVLSRIYGDWRNPNPGYLYWRDCGAIIERYPWTGERRPPD
jgi:hypothetical protein